MSGHVQSVVSIQTPPECKQAGPSLPTGRSAHLCVYAAQLVWCGMCRCCEAPLAAWTLAKQRASSSNFACGLKLARDGPASRDECFGFAGALPLTEL